MIAPLLMQSLPNSGSTWFADILARHLPGCRYYMELFNPLRTPACEEILMRRFGCELAGAYVNIAAGDDALLDADIRSVLEWSGCTFTKEVFSPFKSRAFARHFRVFVFLRTPEDSFPPARLRVWSFYEHAWHALASAGVAVGATTVRERALEAHAVMSRRLVEDAEALRVPVLWWHELMGAAPAVRQALERILVNPEDDNDALLAAVLTSRRARTRASTAA